MSLQAKFLVLIGLLGLTVVMSTGAALWSARMVHAELVAPLAGTARVLGRLQQLKTGVGQMRATLSDDSPSEFAGDVLQSHMSSCEADLDYLSIERWRPVQPFDLRARFGAVMEAAGEWLDDGDREAQVRAISELDQIQVWLERRERHVLDDAAFTMSYGGRTWRQLLFILGVALVIAVLLSALGLSFLRRWISVPVASLREATARIAAGDLDHRIPVHGNDELARLSTEVNQMATIVRTMQEERVERERLAAAGQLVRRLVHNLRNPLAGIRGLAELTRVELEPGSELCENQDRIIMSVDRFERWLSELMDATSPLSVTPAPCRLEPWLTGLVEAHRAQAHLKRVDLLLDLDGAPQEVVIDAHHLEHAIVALISNAIDASPLGGTVSVQAGADNGTTWEVAVSDQGPGVPEDIQPVIFKPYFTTKADGNGIGLAVAQQVARAHGGLVEFRQAAGRTGAVFVLSMPIRPAAATTTLMEHE